MRARHGLAPAAVVVVLTAIAAGVADRVDVPPELHVHGGFVDLSVYRYGGRLVLDGLPLYGTRDPATNLRFTYPPFAAVAMVPLALLPGWLVTALWTGASVAALTGVIVVAARALNRPVTGWPLAVLTAGALALEPVWQNLTFGQINLLLMLALLYDVVHPERRWSGWLVGIAAGIKLTPLVFILLLVLAGQRRAAGRALLAFAGTIAVGFAVAPGPAWTYWTDGLFSAGRVGPPDMAHNQSVFGELTRLLDGVPANRLWLAVAGPIALAVVVLGTVWWRRGDRVLGAGFAALAMLLASPVSWSHHWVWAAPIGLALWTYSRWAAALWTLLFASRMFVWVPWRHREVYGWGPAEHLLGNAYLLATLSLCLWAVVVLTRRTAPPLESSAGDEPLTDSPRVAGS
ncbi:membrane protein [Paractinoplanes abujensis]|nr:membrane protein [Actinoplanes abujensis]